MYMSRKFGKSLERSRATNRIMKESNRKRREHARTVRKEKRDTKELLNIARNRYMVMGEFRSSVIICYAFRALSLGMKALALNWSQQDFENVYVREVHAKDSQDPPALTRMLYTFLSISATMQLMVFLLFITLFALFKRRDNAFRIDHRLMDIVIKDTVADSVFVLVVGAIIAVYMKRKRYFDFKIQGGRTSLAYRDIMFGVCTISTFIPFRYVFESVGIM